MTPEAEAVVLAAGAAAATGAVGAPLVWALAQRKIVPALVAALLVVDLSVAAGVVVSARSMFINEHDRDLLLLVVAAAAAIALAYGLLIGRPVRALDARATAEAAGRARDAQVEAKRRELVAWASHDLRSPISGIQAMAEALDDGVAPATYPRRIRAEADRMAAMVDDLLALSRLQSGALRLTREQVSVADLVSDALAAARPVAAEAGVALDGSALDSADAVVDAREVSRVLDNLLANAVRHTPRGGQVRVAAASAGPDVVITVSDGCGGIDPDCLDRMFEPWWRGSPARTPGVGHGAGLGLAVVEGIVTAHAGSVRAENAGAGCRIEVRLPARPVLP
jgi:signal transduction histidine kinase